MSDVPLRFGEPMPLKRVLENRQLGMQYVVSTGRVEFLRSDAFDRFVTARLTAFVLSDRIAEDSYSEKVSVPDSVWQHWKDAHAPAWFVRRWPVRTKDLTLTVRVERFLNYPDASVSVPELGRPVIYEQVDISRGF